jgi:hypothetical protein
MPRKVAPAHEGDRAQMAKNRFRKKARQILAEECRGLVHRRFPSQWLDKTLEEIAKAAAAGDKSAKTALKLLTDRRYRKA